MASADSKLRIITASDLHYIAPSLTDSGEYYQRVLDHGDSKFMPYIEEICSAFFEEVEAAKPDVLILTGDLTFNGAIISHEALIRKLREVESAGIPVIVQTGNHDVYNTNAARFHGDSFTRVPSATTEDFARLYADFGLNEALSVDSDSLSYLYPLNEKYQILMLDLNTGHDFCGISENTLHWVRQQLEQAQNNHINILAAGHQNIYQHSIFRGGYVISGADKLISLFRSFNVPLYLSGHLHIQHILEKDHLTEIATSALCSYPCQYAFLDIRDDQLIYRSQQLDMAAWAERHRREEAVFQSFPDAAADYMTRHFSGTSSAPDDTEAGMWSKMADYLQKLNLVYFAGDLRGVPDLDPDGSVAELWLRPNDLTSAYVSSVLTDAGKDFTVWSGRWQ